MQGYQISGFKIKLGGLFLICFFILTHASGQTPGKVEVIKDPQIDSLIARRIALSKTGVKATGAISGFQVQIYLGSDRQAAYEAQNRFKSLYPSINTYISYTEPNYKVQAGDFRSRMEAQKLVNDLKQTFSTLLIIPASVNPSQ
jgi:hypothetical protein